MHGRSASALTRLLVTALLLLAVSPVTAPFVTFDLQDCGGDSTSAGAALVQPKTTHDEPATTTAGPAAMEVLPPVRTPDATPSVQRVSRSEAFLIPLRV